MCYLLLTDLCLPSGIRWFCGLSSGFIVFSSIWCSWSKVTGTNLEKIKDNIYKFILYSSIFRPTTISTLISGFRNINVCVCVFVFFLCVFFFFFVVVVVFFSIRHKCKTVRMFTKKKNVYYYRDNGIFCDRQA